MGGPCGLHVVLFVCCNSAKHTLLLLHVQYGFREQQKKGNIFTHAALLFHAWLSFRPVFSRWHLLEHGGGHTRERW